MSMLRFSFRVVVLALAASSAVAADTLDYPGLGTVAVERPVAAPSQFVIFLSGDGGWNKGVVDMARHLVDQGAMVAGVDVAQMSRLAPGSQSGCVQSAATLEGLSHFVQQKYGLPQYLVPVLVGYSSGATLAYATLVQAPAGTFKGALSLGFCPDLEWPRPLCRGEGLEHDPAPKRGFIYRPVSHLQEPWVALQGEQDQVCDAAQTRAFASRVPGAEMLALPKVGHGFSVERNWLPQFTDAFHKVVAGGATAGAVPPAPVADLPLIELPVQRPQRGLFAIMLSGDGGWAGLDKEVAAQLNARGVPVVGWDSLRYFWNARTPDGAAHDLDRVIRYYASTWGMSRVLLVGYSQGADVMPFMVNRLPSVTRPMIARTALIGVSTEAFFEFSVSHWVGNPTGGTPVLPELQHGRLGPVTCIYGSEDRDTPCRTLRVPGLRAVELPGGHHFNGDYPRVAGAVLADLSG